MASDLKSDLVMTAFQRRPTAHLMGNPAVWFRVHLVTLWEYMFPTGVGGLSLLLRLHLVAACCPPDGRHFCFGGLRDFTLLQSLR